jgi:hypothetical protein
MARSPAVEGEVEEGKKDEIAKEGRKEGGREGRKEYETHLWGEVSGRWRRRRGNGR